MTHLGIDQILTNLHTHKMDLIPTDAFDRTSDDALINLVPPPVASAMMDAHKKAPHLFGMDERDLFQKLRSEGLTPSPTSNRMRLAFWMEVDRCRSEGCSFETSRVYGGICSKQFFYGIYLSSAASVAWLLTPVIDYETKMREALDFGMDRMRAILEKDPGTNIKLMELQAKLVTMFDLRLKGGHTQRTESKTLNITVSDKKAAHTVEDMSIEKLEKKIRELKGREAAITAQPIPLEIKDVSNT